MIMEEAERIKKIPPYLFTIMDKLRIEAISKGNEVIDLGMGNPDLPTPKHIVDELCLAAQKVA
ncbi:MAG: alanine transaminase, partial [Planctomycetes bacterium]|nr:alanine transaminase [Planctomycetota bacterium]